MCQSEEILKKFDMPVNTLVIFGSDHAAAMLKGKEDTILFYQFSKQYIQLSLAMTTPNHLAYIPLASKEKAFSTQVKLLIFL